MSNFSSAIGLYSEWPTKSEQDKIMNVQGLHTWAQNYYSAAELLYFSVENQSLEFHCGPVMQTVGLATELALKALLRGSGKSVRETKKFGHNTYQAYLASTNYFDEVKFINIHMSNTAHLPFPNEINIRMVQEGTDDGETQWRTYFNHLRLLDSVYSRPYRTRYITPGEITLPDAEIVLIGTKLLLNAMEERLNN